MTKDAQAYSISLDTTISMSDALKEYQKGIASFSGLGSDAITFLTIKNPSDVNRVSDRGDTKDIISVYSRTGRNTITSGRYMDLVDSHRPDIFHPLCDGETNADSTNKRVIKSAEKTKSFFIHCLERYRQSDSLKTQSLFVGKETSNVVEANCLHVFVFSSDRRWIQFKNPRRIY